MVVFAAELLEFCRCLGTEAPNYMIYVGFKIAIFIAIFDNIVRIFKNNSCAVFSRLFL